MIASDNFLTRLRLNGSPRHLATVRIVIGSYLLYLALLDGDLQVLKDLAPVHLNLESIVPLSLTKLAWDHAHGLMIGTALAALAMVIGLFTRTAIVLTTVGFYLLYSNFYDITYYHNEWPYFWFILLVLGLSRCGDAWSVDSLIRSRRRGGHTVTSNPDYRWPVELCMVWFGFTYFAAGYSKMIPLSEGWKWLNGGTIQWLMMTRYFDSPSYWLFDTPVFDYTTSSPFVVMAVLTVLCELSGILFVFSRRLHLPVYLCVLSVHVNILLFSGMPGFMRTALVCGVFLLPPRLFGDLREESADGGAGATTNPTPSAVPS